MAAAPAFTRTPKVLVADDRPAILKAVTNILAPYFNIVATASDGEAALDAAARTNPDLAVLDINMPRLDGIGAAKQLKGKRAETEIVFLTGEDDDELILASLEAGAKGYVVKRRMQSEILPALALALAGQFFISPHGFTPTLKSAEGNHSLQFYLDESVFLGHVSDVAYKALARSEQVFVFLSKIGLKSLRQRLKSGGLDCFEAIRGRYLHTICVDRVLPLLMTDDSHVPGTFETIRGQRFRPFRATNTMRSLIEHPTPDPARFAKFFWPYFRRASVLANERNSSFTIISDLMSTLLRYGHSHEAAARVEQVWNDIIPRHSCTVYCGCPLMHLSSKENRKTLVEICHKHSRVTAIDRATPSHPTRGTEIQNEEQRSAGEQLKK